MHTSACYRLFTHMSTYYHEIHVCEHTSIAKKQKWIKIQIDFEQQKENTKNKYTPTPLSGVSLDRFYNATKWVMGYTHVKRSGSEKFTVIIRFRRKQNEKWKICLFHFLHTQTRAHQLILRRAHTLTILPLYSTVHFFYLLVHKYVTL